MGRVDVGMKTMAMETTIAKCHNIAMFGGLVLKDFRKKLERFMKKWKWERDFTVKKIGSQFAIVRAPLVGV